jgi:phage FluMu protein Com
MLWVKEVFALREMNYITLNQIQDLEIIKIQMIKIRSLIHNKVKPIVNAVFEQKCPICKSINLFCKKNLTMLFNFIYKF